MMKNRLIWLALALVAMLSAAAKPAYRIDLRIDGNADTMMMLGYYMADNTYVCDTAWPDKAGRFRFEGQRQLEPGLYYFANGSGRYVEFVVYKEKPYFQFHTNERNWSRNMTVKGSAQNEIFYNFNRSTDVLYDQLAEMHGKLDSAAFERFKREQYLRIDTLRLKLIAEHPEAMLSKMMLATKEVEVPATSPKGDTLSQNERWEYFMHHYFDNVPLDDNFIIRTPQAIFYRLVTEYVDKYMRGLPPAMICPLLDSLIDRAEPAPEVYRWLVHTLTEKYLQSNVMVYDEVYVHLAQRYYGSGKATWAAPSVIDDVVGRANKWERLLVGRESPELILFDTLRHVWSLHHMPGKYTLLLFWSPTCGHCRDIVPEMYKVFAEWADSLDMTAFAILTEPEEQTVEKWKRFLQEQGMDSPRWVNLNGGEANVDWRQVYDVTSTPQIYLIENERHTFIAKKLNASIFADICKRINK